MRSILGTCVAVEHTQQECELRRIRQKFWYARHGDRQMDACITRRTPCLDIWLVQCAVDIGVCGVKVRDHRVAQRDVLDALARELLEQETLDHLKLEEIFRDVQKLPTTREAAMAKLFSSQVAQRAAGSAIEWAGGQGFTREQGIEKYWRDSKIGAIYEGTSNIQLNTIFNLTAKEKGF